MAASGFRSVVESLLAEGLRVRFRAAGRSMMPTVRDGECLIVAPVRAAEVSRGDVVLGATWRRLVAHRVVGLTLDARGGRVLTLRGDGSDEADAPVDASRVLGQVVAVERDGRALSVAPTIGGRLRLARRMLAPLVAAAWARLARRPISV